MDIDREVFEEAPKLTPHRLVRRSLKNPMIRTDAVHRDREKTGSGEKVIRHRRHVGVLTSVAVGILIAIIAFPAINFAKNHARLMVAQNKIKELNRGIAHYTPAGTNVEQSGPAESFYRVNLARSGWQEIDHTPPSILTVTDGTEVNCIPVTTSPIPFGSLQSFQPVSVTPTFTFFSQGQDIILGQVPANLDKTDTRSLAYQTLLTDGSPTVPRGNGSTVQMAYGQNVLFQNGRVFLRILPVFNQRPPTE